MSCPIPIDLNIQKHWRNHELVTDEMVAWFKKQINCQPYQGIMDFTTYDKNKLIILL
tara:strand:+ start:344 stop:514 length:171 start_codon:yes stop_codon:yes gene_type:complete